MPLIMIATSKVNGLSELVSMLTLKTDVEGFRVESGKMALDAAEKLTPDLIVIDEQLDDMSGLDLAQRVLSVNAFINTALVSSLSDEDFHEASEGLGVLMKLSPEPVKNEADILLKKLASIS